MDYGLKELNEQLQILVIGEKEIRQMWNNTKDSELKILLNDTLEIIREHQKQLGEEILFLNEKIDTKVILPKGINMLKDNSINYKGKDRNIVIGTIKIIEIIIKNFDDILKLKKLKTSIEERLKIIKNKYYNIDTELENYIQRLDNKEI